MTMARDAQSLGFERARQSMRRLGQTVEIPPLDGMGTRAVEAWFLGPKAENADELERLVVEAIRDQAFWRRNFHPSDATHITEEIKRSTEYLQAMDTLRESYSSLLAFLKKSVPFFSMRYQGHMNWDLTLPSIVGYFAAMLYNPNNVAFEGSTATTILELLVGDDLCQMLGYAIPSAAEIDRGAIRPWGHITCDGTVANIEAIWSARNLKLYPLAMQAALANEESLAAARGLEVRVPTGGEAPLRELGPWEALNLDGDTILALSDRLIREYGIAREALTEAVARYAPQNLGLSEFGRRFMGGIERSPVFLVAGTKHYSFPKAAAVLGIGSANMIDLPVDLDARISIPALRKVLEACLTEQRPVYAVVAVIGTTEESAVDPLADVLEVRREFRQRGLEFTVHADGAFGGYHASMVRADFPMPEPAFAAGPPPVIPLSGYVRDQFLALGEADSITVDPHKSGFIPYPAGALCYRNSARRDLVTFSAPVVFHGDQEPTVGIYGIEGSKPGAAAASVYLSHRVIRPSRSGYGRILGQAMFSCKRLYARLLCMVDDRFVAVPLPRLPAEREHGDPEAQLAFIRDRIDRRIHEELIGDADAMALLPELGPDENILAYAFNFRMASGGLNPELEEANRLNRAVYDRLSINPGEDIYGYNLLVSTTDLAEAQYGNDFIEDYKRRLGVAGSSGSTITVLRSVVMDPWITETRRGSFLDVLEVEFRKAVSAALENVMPSQVRGY